MTGRKVFTATALLLVTLAGLVVFGEGDIAPRAIATVGLVIPALLFIWWRNTRRSKDTDKA